MVYEIKVTPRAKKNYLRKFLPPNWTKPKLIRQIFRGSRNYHHLTLCLNLKNINHDLLV